jgi:glycosyltransferase involved in cell wall biosynthesis
MKMRIGFISEVFYPYGKGGSERRYWEVAQRLSDKHEVHVYTMRPFETGKEDMIENIKVQRITSFRSLFTKRGRRTAWPPLKFAGALLKKLFYEDLDIIDASAFPYFSCFPAKAYSTLHGTPLAVTFHEVWGQYWNEYLGYKVLGNIGFCIERLCARMPDAIVSVSEHTSVKLIETLGVSPKTITVIPNGVDLALFNRVETERFPFRILYVGRLVEHKHVDWLIHAMRYILQKIPDSELVIIGDGPEKLRLERLAKELHLSGKTRFFGGLERYEDVALAMKSASVLVLPSTREGFGLVLLEAMAAGTPTIAIKDEQSAATDIIRPGWNGVLAPSNDVRSLADIIVGVLKDQEFQLKLAQNGREYVENFGWNKIAERLERLYASLL